MPIVSCDFTRTGIAHPEQLHRLCFAVERIKTHHMTSTFWVWALLPP